MRSKLFSVLPIYFGLIIQSAFSQQAPGTFLNKARIDYAVPDAPAFKVLQIDLSSVSRPVSAREVAITISNILQGGKIPDNYALEISPGLIFSNSLPDYQKNPFWYRTRISLATKTSENSARHLGAGIRVTLIDNTDLRMDKNLQTAMVKLGQQSDELKSECISELINEGVDAENPEFEQLLNEKLEKKGFEKISDDIEKQREIYKKKKWNESIVEIGFAVSATSKDSLIDNLSANSYRWWLSGAFPLGEDGQIITGVNGGITKNDNGELKNTESNFGLRAYYGTNYHKLFLEGSLRTASSFTPMLTFNIGYEYNLSNGIWADLSIGIIKKESKKFASTSSLNLRLATPE
jgi:hypothetical protein